ncbi:MAG: TasA family protein [Solirubrobacteraceae bacterium]|nr:TasA family protein [Solirubrobacteraceae bacterium]
MPKSNRKRSTISAVAVILLLAAGAYAYWTAGGSGSGSGTAGDTVGLIVNQTTVVDDMHPGDTAQTISGNFNNANEGPIYVGTVTAAISSVVKAVGAPAGDCDATDFTLASGAMTVNAQVPVGTGVGTWTGATIKFNNKADANQDACKGATVNLAYTIS